MASRETKVGLKGRLLERLHNPVQLRVIIAGVGLVVGYLAIYAPLESSINETTRQLEGERKRLELGRQVEHLRAQVANFKKRLPLQRDPNEWVEYTLGEVRKLPLKLVALDVRAQQDVGPYKAVVLHVELEGAFRDMDELLRWLESNERLFRIDAVKIDPHRSGNGTLVMQLTVLGIMG